MQYEPVTPNEFAMLGGLDEWRLVLRSIHAAYDAGSYPAAASLVTAIGEAAERLVHHPDLEVRYPGRVHVALTTHATGGLTNLDVELAREISALARAAGAAPAPTAHQAIELAIGTLHPDTIRSFWAAVLDYRIVEGDLVDPRHTGPPVWFQQIEVPRPGHGRFHVDVSVPHDVAEERVAAALAAGGRLVTDRFAPAWWVLADVEGNEVCVSTWQGRGPAADP